MPRSAEAREVEAVIDWIPGLPAMPLGDFSGFLRNMDDPDNFGLRFNETETTNCGKADAVLVNTYEALEPDALAALRAEYPRVYTVGPLGSLLRHTQPQPGGRPDVNSNGLMMSLWRKDDARCLAWLDAQPEPGSVVYVSFGSHAVLTPAQAAELAWGLADAGHPFLWAAREDLITGLTKQQQRPTIANGDGALLAAVLPPEFFESTTGGPRCLITTWCAQEEVLRHAAVGCFVTHAGWNSACEGVAAGVPMLCWPGFADQYTNARLACHVWGVGARLLLDGGELRREEVAARVREVMRAKEMAERAKEWKDMAEEAASPGGTSYENLQSVVKAMVNDSTSVVPADDDQQPAKN
ncbi:hypothetical protein PR202_ga12170 [Eleusine coracana subsp. coracana]|uniref:UDP-glycosyltransferases domain-containing protein n=1 Tax=Eleusine coracana subsp. coracana TaxID=191504 RepID=A0AAV5CBD7_ELECO|nr:hypothetical protein PR202_ga12170 [Eleusine coracana subsp. coracana]